MSYIKEEIYQVSNNLDIKMLELDYKLRLEVLKKINRHFFNNDSDFLSWKLIKNSEYTYHHQLGWKIIKSLPDYDNLILFFEESDDKSMFVFENKNDLYSVIAGSIGFEFYVCDKDITYLICFNFHDMLIMFGKECINFLDKLKIEFNKSNV